jgi:excisionase family DNA binding protein
MDRGRLPGLPEGDPMSALANSDRSPAPQLLLTPREAAEALSISERALWQLTYPRGQLPVVRLGRSVRYDVQALRDYITARRQGGGAA